MASSEKRPNILFIMSDDIGWFNISCNNNGIMGYRTPNIDRITGGIAELEQRTQGRLVLAGLDLGARLAVIDGDRPEQLARNRQGHGQTVKFATVQILAARIAQAQPIE